MPEPILSEMLPAVQYDIVAHQQRIALSAIAYLPASERLAAMVVVDNALDCAGSAASQMAALEAIDQKFGQLIFNSFRKAGAK